MIQLKYDGVAAVFRPAAGEWKKLGRLIAGAIGIKLHFRLHSRLDLRRHLLRSPRPRTLVLRERDGKKLVAFL